VRGLFFKAFAIAFALSLSVWAAWAQDGGFGRAPGGRNALDDSLLVLQLDNGTVVYPFKFPDVYGDDLRNQRFRAPENCSLVGVMMAFGTRGFRSLTTGSPALVTKVWASGADSFPNLNAELASDTLSFSQYSASVFDVDSVWRNVPAQFVMVDLTATPVSLTAGEWFHVGYTAIRGGSGDTLAILADGNTGSIYSSEFYNGHFELMQTGFRGVDFLIRAIVSIPSAGISVLAPGDKPESFALYPAYPNPFNPQTTISFDLSRPQAVKVTVLDILGRERAELAGRVFSAGTHRLSLNGQDWSSGMYFVRLEAQGHSRTQRILLEK
jgi:hypothetical protein